MRNVLILFAILTAAVTGSAEEGNCFSVEILSEPQPVLLGLPIELKAEVRNVCGRSIRAAIPDPGLLFPMILETTDPDGVRGRVCLYRRASFAVVEKEIPADWRVENTMIYHPRKSGTYTFRFVFLPEGYAIFYNGENAAELYWTSARSDLLQVSVTEPEGVDREAFEAYDGDPLAAWTRPRDPGRYGDLLRRFPTSTYAAYMVWHRRARGVLRGSMDGFIFEMTKDIRRQSNSVPCDPEVCGPNGRMSLSGREYVEWRVRWFEIVLEHHPQIWFADEVRLKLARDRYFLGDPDAMAAELEYLVEHGEPLAAKKSRELLETMKAKGILEGGLRTEEGPEAASTK